MAENNRGTIFSRLVDTLRGFRTGVDTEQQRKILSNNPPISPYDSVEQKQQEFLDVQSSKIAYDLYTRSIYYDTDRLTAYNDFKAMDNSPEISAALDILTDEISTRNEAGEILQVYSNNSRIKNVLRNLFFNSLNINYNLMFWSREMMKFGDCFVKLEVDRKYGVHDCNVLPVAEIHREEAYDGNLNSTRFRWDLNNMYFEEWQMAHFRIVTDSSRLPYGRCLKWDTYVETSDGFKFIKDIEKGDTVYSFDLKTQEKIETKVLDTVFSGQKEIYKIRTKNNEIESSLEHNFLTYNSLDKKFEYKSIESLKINDLLIINKKTETNVEIKLDKDISDDINKNGYRKNLNLIPDYLEEDFAMLFGFLLGDGWINNNSVYFAMGSDDNLNHKYINLLEKYSGKQIFLIKNPNREGELEFSQAQCNSKMLVKILKKNGFEGNVYSKRFPKWIFNSNEKIQKAFMQGLYDADGSIFIDKWNCTRFSLELTNEYLIKDAKFLLQRLGKKTGKICTRERGNGKSVFWGKEYNKKKSFYFYYYDSDIVQKKKYELDNRLEENFILEPIISIEKTNELSDVYDIYVENENHNFYANGIVVHNSILEPARKLWKQLQLAEDAMLVYRMVRAPERRVYYIEVGNTDPKDVPQYMEKMKAAIKKSSVVDPKTGQVNLKYNPLTYEEDYFLPMRGDKSSKVETLAGACISLDTKIPLLDGRVLKLSEIIEEYEKGNKNMWVYSCDPKTGSLAPGIITWAGVTRKNTDVLKITLDNGEEIISTPDHKFVHRTNGFVEAKDLVVGDSLMPFYRKIDTDSQFVFDQSVGDYVDFNLILKDFRNKHKGCTSLTYQKKCEQCDKSIKSNDSYNHFNRVKLCSRDCYKEKRSNVYNGSKLKQYKGVKDTIQICNFCNNEFKKTTKRKFCSKKCSNQSMFKYDVILKKCMGCGENMSVVNNGKNKNFCTLDCKKDFYFKNKNNISNIRNNRRYYKKHHEIFNLVRKNHDDTCQFCFKEKTNKNLDVHHIIASKLFENIEDSFEYKNLIPLHSKCHQFRFEEIIANELYNEGYIIKHEDSKLMIDLFTDKINQFYEQLYIDYSDSSYNEFEEYLSDKTKKDKNIVHFINLDIINCSPENLIIFNNIKDYWDYCKSHFKDLFKKNRLSKVNSNYNHKIVKIEWLETKIDTGTITVDGEEKYHNYHTFAIESGVFIKNSNLNDILDVVYLQDKLFTAIQVPKAYLNYSEKMEGGSTLAQVDLRFARTINRLQEMLLIELRRIANIHLFMLGFQDDMDNFDLKLTNPSTQQELLKLEVMKARLEVFKEMFSAEVTSPTSYTWAMQNILGFSESEIKLILRQKKVEKKMFAEIEEAAENYKKTGIFKIIDDKFGKGEEVEASAEAGAGEEGGLEEPGGLEPGMEEKDEETPELPTGGGEETLAENTLLSENKKLFSKTKSLLENLDKKFKEDL